MEIEFKFSIPPEHLAAVQAAVLRGRHSLVRMQARYFDTPDGALAARGIALRLRCEGAHWVQTVKALGHGPLDREEHNVDRGPALASMPALDPLPQLHAGTVAGTRLQQALLAADGPLVETYGTDMDRIVRRLRIPGGVAELALDTGRVVARRGTDQQSEARICELELELLSGPVKSLAMLATQWAVRHGLSLSTVSKAERGERLLAAPAGAPPAVKAAPWKRTAPRHRWMHGPTLLRAVVGHCLRQILGNASEVAEGTGGEEHIHQLRIGIRRLRTALRYMGPLEPGRLDAAWEPALVDVFQRLGRLRDQRQALQALAAELQAAGAPALDLAASAARPPAHADAADIVGIPAFQAALIGLMALTVQPPSSTDAADNAGALDARATRRVLRQSLRHLHAQVGRDARGFAALPPEQQHRLRKRLKRLRYLTESAAPAMDGQAEPFLASLQPALAALGRLNDERVAQAVYADLAASQPAAWFAVGWLAARQNATAAACEAALAEIAELPRLAKPSKPRKPARH